MHECGSQCFVSLRKEGSWGHWLSCYSEFEESTHGNHLWMMMGSLCVTC